MTKSPKGLAHGKTRSSSKLKLGGVQEVKVYSIEVTCPQGWPLTLDQWKRVNEVRNTHEPLESAPRKAAAIIKEKDKGKPGTARGIDKTTQVLRASQLPQIGDAYVELECAIAVGGGAIATRDDERDLAYLAARRSWAAFDSGRNQTGAHIRKEFRTEFMVAPVHPVPPSSNTYLSGLSAGSSTRFMEGAFEIEPEETKVTENIQRPTPVSESDMFEMSLESEEIALFLSMPDILRDKFIPLDFLLSCTKEKNEEDSILVTPEMAEAAKNNRHARIEAALERMRELQLFNEEHVLGGQKVRCKLLENLFVDATFSQDLIDMLEQKEEAVATEVNLRTLSATKKKSEAKEKKK